MKAAIFTVLASASIFGTIPQVQAWGVLGHQTVALLAQSYLLPSTVTKVKAILNGMHILRPFAIQPHDEQTQVPRIWPM
jgi:hypothetical protein